jgi:hypothetical protein
MNPFWTIPRMWEGQSAVILASGPSMSAEIANVVRYAPTYRAIAVNNTHELAPWADMLYAADEAWWKRHREKALAFEGLKVTCTENSLPNVLRLREGARDGFDPDPGVVCTGGNSGYQAIHVAVHAGCKRILLCGFDMRGTHWHDPHQSPLRDHGDGIYAKWIEKFKTLVAPLAERGVDVINCTPGSALRVWPSRQLEEALLNEEELAA